jgi:aspartate aminotransferase
VVAHSATLALNERMAARRAAGRPVVHLGFGEAGLPVLPAVAAVLRAAVGRNSYGPVAGSLRVREAVAGWFGRRGTPTGPDQVVVAPGSKALLYSLIASLPGDVVLPTPSWVSYAAQAALAGRSVLGVPVPAGAGGVPDPELLGAALRQARDAGRRPGILVLTLPDNPTGTVAGPDLVARVCEVAAEYDLAIVSDEIYRDLCHEPGRLRSPATLAPERCFVTGGLSKSMALGGWRIGFARLPAGPLGERTMTAVVGVASEVWSALAAPMQEAAAYVLDDPPEVTAHVAASRELHRRVATAVYEDLVSLGVRCRPPQAAFYLYPDLAPARDRLAGHGLTDADSVAERLLDRYGVGVLSGTAFGDEPSALRFRIATSLLYGAGDDERWQALRSDRPQDLPWIVSARTRFRSALHDLIG